MSLITLLTDFGHRDPYVGTMKGVLLSHHRSLSTVDLTHQIPPQEVQAASFWLGKTFSYFPPGTTHLAVVDPGVGTARRALAMQAGGHQFVAPDNGLLSDVLAEVARHESPVRVVSLEPHQWETPPEGRGSTFHGRDLFAPAAARLAMGTPLDHLGPRIEKESLVCWDVRPQTGEARVRVIDHFGNLITDAPNEWTRGTALHFRGQPIPWVNTYGEAPLGQLVALPGSWGTLEIAVNGGSAAELTGAKTGSRFTFGRAPSAG